MVLHHARADKAGEVSQGFCTTLEPTGWGGVTRVLHYTRADKAGEGVTMFLHCARADKAGEVSQWFCTALEPTRLGRCHKGSALR